MDTNTLSSFILSLKDLHNYSLALPMMIWAPNHHGKSMYYVMLTHPPSPPPPPPTTVLPPLTMSGYTGGFINTMATPMKGQPPMRINVYQSYVVVNGSIDGADMTYTCTANCYVCYPILNKQLGPQSWLVQVMIYPTPKCMDSTVPNYASPFTIVMNVANRNASLTFPALVNTTTSVTQQFVEYNYDIGTGIVPTRYDPNYYAMATSQPGAGTYFVSTNMTLNPNVAQAFNILFEYKSIKPVLNMPNGDIRTLILSKVSSAELLVYEAVDMPLSIKNYTKTTGAPAPPTPNISDILEGVSSTSFKTRFTLPSYRQCTYGYSPSVEGWTSAIQYPFGVIAVQDNGATDMAFSFFASKYSGSNAYAIDCYFGRVNIPMPGPFVNDTRPPVVKTWNLTQVSAHLYVVRVNIVDDLSGFGRMMLYFETGDMIDITIEDLIEGDSLDGTYEKAFMIYNITNLVNPKYSYILSDRVGNSPIADNAPLGFMTSSFRIGADDLTVFYFDKYEMDVSSAPMNNTLYLASPRAKPNWKPIIFFGSIDDNPNYMATGYYDAKLKLFVIPFTVPARTMTTKMKFFINFQLSDFTTAMRWFQQDSASTNLVIDSAPIQALFPSTSIVNIISQYGDELPPQLAGIDAHPSLTVTLDANSQATIGWNISIRDEGNGFARGVFNVISTVDGTPRRFEFTPANRTSGDDQYGNYEIRFQVDSKGRNQTYTFLDIELFDKSMNRALYESAVETFKTLSPIAYIISDYVHEFNINVTTYQVPSDSWPRLESLQFTRQYVDVGTQYRDVEVFFTVRAYDYSLRHMPCVYLTGLVFEIYKMEARLVNVSADNVYTFTATGYLPYAFATSTGNGAQVIPSPMTAMVSLYGLMDTNQHMVGYSNDQLPGANVQKTLLITYTHNNPVLDRYIVDTDGIVTVFGKNFAPNCSLVAFAGDQPDFHFPPNTSIFTRIDGVYVIATFSFNLTEPTSLYIQMRNNDTLISNNLLFNYVPQGGNVTPPVDPPGPTINCTGTGNPPCSGNGVCSPTFGCQCNGTWYGDDCSSHAVPTTPVINPDSPTTVYTFNISGLTIVGEIEVIRVRVLDQLGAELVAYPLNQWNVSTITNQSFDYVSAFGQNSGARIKVNVRWFTEDEDIKFAGDILPMKKNTIKYTITLSNYTFPSQLDSMQVVMRATINTTDANSCSVQQYGFANQSDGDLYWMRVKVQSYSVYGHFIQKALVDGRPSRITNVLLDETTQIVNNNTQSSQTLIGINVHAFEKQALMDPDFQLLLDIDDAKDVDGAICKRGSSGTKLSGLAIAGIVVLCVAFVAAIVVAIVFRMRANRRQKKELGRINVRLAQMNQK
ncbi:hypothetical protein SAMD00019534_116420 [Acytostelium subglobosum LB1]|uniref:hypothetical protein n=1 Tax=Acytostelium subglobosum LB1 TaxID=1410327 RepID=UPI000644F06C|nr:hypothetical protein SAMD00019534_116420 [Acytostelium subglobosum LB1]GAM28466.1 hypothetical protein SAMD00019534_116420 [Acytostelium subglobosum LB1]|eukprot:XP_012748505.1 hypothetical protein SAMD00019534_116420 [Acytostelium subglobosum LB1]